MSPEKRLFLTNTKSGVDTVMDWNVTESLRVQDKSEGTPCFPGTFQLPNREREYGHVLPHLRLRLSKLMPRWYLDDIWGSSVQIKAMQCSETESSEVKPMSAVLLSFHCPILANCAVGRQRPLPPPASHPPPTSPSPPTSPPSLAPLAPSSPANESWEG